MFRNPTTDLIVVLVIVLLIWGPKRLPGLGRQLGGGLRGFKDSITGDDDGHEEQAERPALPPHTGSSPVPAATPPGAPVSGHPHDTAGGPTTPRSPDAASERSS